MDRLRRALQKLDWPVARFSDQQIIDELCRRWLEADATPAPACLEPDAHAAWGIFARMARAGNLDALCWEWQDGVEGARCGAPETRGDKSQIEAGVTSSLRCSVRQGKRQPPGRHDALEWQTAEAGHYASGWLVQCADADLAFVAQTAQVPPLGAEILPTIRARGGWRCSLGTATIVRTEMLNEELSLVCAELKEPWIAHG